MPSTPFSRAAEAVDMILAQPYPTNGSVIVEAVLQELREPSHEMTEPIVQPGQDRTKAVKMWQAMIDAALSEGVVIIPRLEK